MEKMMAGRKGVLFKLNQKIIASQNKMKVLVRGNINEDTYKEIRNY